MNPDGAAITKEKASSPRKIEYIKVPRHWFSEPMSHAMKTVVRPPTARTRRKEMKIELRMPMQIFLELMAPFNTEDLKGLEWTSAKKTMLKPTKTGKAFNLFKYSVDKPEAVDLLWRLQDREPAEPKGRKPKDGEVIPHRRGHGSARLHLSHAAQGRGEKTDLLAQVAGAVTVTMKVPHHERVMPTLTLLLKVATMDGNGHIIWPRAFGPSTAAALRNQMRSHLKKMIDDPQYPTLTQMVPSLTQSSESNRQYDPLGVRLLQ